MRRVVHVGPLMAPGGMSSVIQLLAANPPRLEILLLQYILQKRCVGENQEMAHRKRNHEWRF